MEWRFLFLGLVGAGKTQAVRSVNDIEGVSTEEQATDATALLTAMIDKQLRHSRRAHALRA